MVHDSLFGDELFLYSIVHNRSLGDVLSQVRETEKTPPLGFVLAWLFDHPGDVTVSLRVPSLLAGVATVPLVYLLGLRTTGRGAGLLAAAWFALDPFQIFYATETRSYAQAAALVVASTLGLLAALQPGPHRRAWWVLYVLAATAAIYTHYTSALVLVPQAAWALWIHREAVRVQLVAHGLVVLAFGPWLPSFVAQARNSEDEARRISEMVPFTLPNVGEAVVRPFAAHPYAALGDLPGELVLAGLALILVVAGAAGLRSGSRARGSAGRARTSSAAASTRPRRTALPDRPKM